jgi:long-chain acyl-CoA synthetase
VFGLNRPHNVALLVADVAALRGWCEEQSIAARDIEALLKEPRVRALMARELETHTKGFKGYERVKDFVLLAEEWSTANDMLTPSMKLKRRNVVARYGVALEALYGTRA